MKETLVGEFDGNASPLFRRDSDLNTCREGANPDALFSRHYAAGDIVALALGRRSRFFDDCAIASLAMAIASRLDAVALSTFPQTCEISAPDLANALFAANTPKFRSKQGVGDFPAHDPGAEDRDRTKERTRFAVHGDTVDIRQDTPLLDVKAGQNSNRPKPSVNGPAFQRDAKAVRTPSTGKTPDVDPS